MYIAKGTLHIVILPFVFCVITLILFFLWKILILSICSVIFLLLGVFGLIFFRDPVREIGRGIVAPADGYVFQIRETPKFKVISTFMRIYDVHVNRTPIEGIVVKVTHLDGKHYPAYNRKSTRNEKVIIVMKTKIGVVKIVQIAGIFARRIVSYLKNGDILEKGQRIGMIRFGSRVDLYLPAKKVKVMVSKKQKIYAGITTVAFPVEK